MGRTKQVLADKFKSLDYFPENITWRHSKGETEFKTYSGAGISLFMYIYFIWFALARFVVMWNRSENSVEE